MIKSFRSKGLQELFTTGKSKKLPQQRVDMIAKLLQLVNAAHETQDFHFPNLRPHRLKAPPYRGYWSIDVSGNFRIIFIFENGVASNVDYQDTH